MAATTTTRQERRPGGSSIRSRSVPAGAETPVGPAGDPNARGLYGQQLSRIAALTTSQITIRDDTVPVRFGDHNVPVPEPLVDWT